MTHCLLLELVGALLDKVLLLLSGEPAPHLRDDDGDLSWSCPSAVPAPDLLGLDSEGHWVLRSALADVDLHPHLLSDPGTKFFIKRHNKSLLVSVSLGKKVLLLTECSKIRSFLICFCSALFIIFFAKSLFL